MNDIAFDCSGEIAGSKLTLNVAVRADLIITDYMMNVKTTIIKGEKQP